ncbi:MAG: hypothetical protein PHO78_05075 [Methanomicrobium sp.]|nr:hypothetical protein [Methanomicrobium sp.]
MNSNTAAVDIVLLPPQNIKEMCIKINKMLIESSQNDQVVFEKNACIPHISLAMGAIELSSLDSLSEKLSGIANKYLPYEARYKGLAGVKVSKTEVVSGIDFIKNSEITDLSEDVISAFSEFNIEKITPDMIFPDVEEITEFTLNYSSSYIKESAGNNFSPHITLGYGDVFDLKYIPEIPQKSVFQKIAVCHLGNHCTCRKILWESS